MSEELRIADGEPQLIDPRDLDEATACKQVAKKNQEQKDPVWVWVAEGIYENTELKQKWKCERPSIGGKRPFQALGTTNLKLAKEERARRITLRATRCGGSRRRPAACRHSAVRSVSVSGAALPWALPLSLANFLESPPKKRRQAC